MNKHLMEQIREEFPDWREWIGELFIQWETVSHRRQLAGSSAKKWTVLVQELKRIRREVRNEGRPPGTFYFGDMDNVREGGQEAL